LTLDNAFFEILQIYLYFTKIWVKIPIVSLFIPTTDGMLPVVQYSRISDQCLFEHLFALIRNSIERKIKKRRTLF